MKTPTKRITKLLERHLREKARGNRHYDKSSALLRQAISAGLMVDQTVDVEVFDNDGLPQRAAFALRDNFAGDEAYRSARIPHFELKKAPKNPRSPQPVAEAAL